MVNSIEIVMKPNNTIHVIPRELSNIIKNSKLSVNRIYLDEINDDNDDSILKRIREYAKRIEPTFATLYLKIVKHYLLPINVSSPYDTLLQNSLFQQEYERHRCIPFVYQSDKATIIPQHSILCKGFEYFIRPEAEHDYYHRAEEHTRVGWFAGSETPFLFVKKMWGGMNAYEAKRDIKLLFMSSKNIRWCAKLLRQAGNPKIAHLLQTMTCTDIPEETCLKEYVSINGWGFPVYLYATNNKTPSSDHCVNYPASYFDKLLHKKYPWRLMWHDTKRDRQIAESLRTLLFEYGYDGYVFPTIYTPYIPFPIEEQIVLFNPSTVLLRKPDHPLDWMSWSQEFLNNVPGLHDTTFQPNHSMMYGWSRNSGFRLLRFYHDHPLHSRRNRWWTTKVATTRKNYPGSLVVLTYNVHQFISINANHTPLDCIRGLLEIIDMFQVDVAVLQEVSTKQIEVLRKQLAGHTLTVVSYHPKTEICILIKHPKLVSKIQQTLYTGPLESEKLPRGWISFVYSNIHFAGTHLDIGKRYTKLSYKAVDAILDTANHNSRLRTNELNQILATTPDVILGDFNMEPWTPEFQVLSDAYDIPDLRNEITTPFGNRVDYIGYLKNGRVHSLLECVVDTNYSDHLPVLHVLHRGK